MAKPRTKLECRVYDLSYNKISPLNYKHIEYAEEMSFWKYFEVSRGHIHCMECGHKWKPEKLNLKRYKCPECSKQLREINNQTWVSVDGYLAVFQRCEEFQVIRYLFSRKHMKKGQEPTYQHIEISQLWYTPDGKLTIMGAIRNGMIGAYGGGWSYPTEGKDYLTIKKESYYSRAMVYKPNGVVYPNKQIIPELRRRGFTGAMMGVKPSSMVEYLFESSIFETLVKQKDKPLIKLFAQDSYTFEKKYWPSIKIARRHNYEIEDLIMWKDYIDLLHEFNKDLRNPKFICPDNLKEAHDKYVEKDRNRQRQRRIQARIRRAEQNKANVEALRAQMAEDERKYAEMRKAFFDLCWKYDDIEITTIKSVQQLDEESTHLLHCAYTNKYHRKSSVLLLSAKVMGEVVETIEVNLRTMEIVQARGFDNKATAFNKKIVSIVKRKMPEIQKLYERQLQMSA